MILILDSAILITVYAPPNSNLDRGSIVQKCAFLTFLHPSEWQRPFHNWMNSLSALTSRTGLVSIHKTIQFSSESLVSLLIIAKTCWWQWWGLATSMSRCVNSSGWVSCCVSHSSSGICFRDHVYLLEVSTCHIWIFEIDYTDTTTRVSITLIDLYILAVATPASKLHYHI